MKQQKILVEFIKKDSAYTFYQMLIESKEIECDVKCITGDDSIYEREKILNPINKRAVVQIRFPVTAS